MVAQAQATAARTGRPAGIAFSGFNQATGDPVGVALEAYFVAQPPAFRGFDEPLGSEKGTEELYPELRTQE